MHAKLILIALLLKSVSSAKILALMTVPSHSHHLWNGKYLEALARRGHEVTYFSVDKFLNPPKNLRQIFVEGAYDVYDSMDFSETSGLGPYQNILKLYQWSEEVSVLVSQSKGFQELKRVMRTEKFDLVVHDIAECWFLLGGVDLLGRPPVVALTAFGIPSSTLSSFGPNIRPLEGILDDINIILVNSNYAIDFPFPKVPGLVPVGGLHIEKPKPLPQELKTFLDEAKSGVVYFSLGSNIKSSMMSTKNVDILREAFRQISPVRVLWKWESGSLSKQPSNVKIAKWVPQNDVLAHPNVRLFFTHSGLLSTQEAVYHGKPMVGLPFFLDQHVNLNKCIERGLGEKLILNSLTVENVVATINQVLTEPRYAENARNLSFLFKDDIESPLDRAVFWTEYAIRHNGAPHLRHSSRSLSWHQNWMLDVMAVTVCIGCLAIWCTCRLVVGVAMVSFGKRRRTDAKKKE